MGQELTARSARSLAEVLNALRMTGVGCNVVMVDGQLIAPSAEPPATWNDVRLRTPAGMITLSRRGPDVGIMVFGNADATLMALRDQIAAAFES
jgi:hypothetical protein